MEGSSRSSRSSGGELMAQAVRRAADLVVGLNVLCRSQLEGSWSVEGCSMQLRGEIGIGASWLWCKVLVFEGEKM